MGNTKVPELMKTAINYSGFWQAERSKKMDKPIIFKYNMPPLGTYSECSLWKTEWQKEAEKEQKDEESNYLC